MSAESWYPRISEAMQFLPMLRTIVLRAAAQHLMPVPLSLELRPLVEHGLFGYELESDRQTHTYVMIGRTQQGTPVVRTSLYTADAPGALRLVSINGTAISQSETTRGISQQREACFADWDTAVEAAWIALGRVFSGRPRQCVKLETVALRSLDAAMSIAYSYVAKWDPFIEFYGLPQEAQRGFALHGTTNERGELIFQRPDIWMLRWKAPPDAVYESWSVVIPDVDTDLAYGDFPP